MYNICMYIQFYIHVYKNIFRIFLTSALVSDIKTPVLHFFEQIMLK